MNTFAGLIVAASAIFLHQSAFAADPAKVVVAAYGGSFQDAQTKAFFDPYAKTTGAKVIGTTGSGHAKIKAMVLSGNITWDVVSADAAAYESEVKDNLLGYFKSGVANAAYEACGLKAEKSSFPAMRNSTVRMVLKLAYPRALRLAA
jgi:hypothetical protein